MLSSKVCSKEKIIEQFKDGQIIAIGGQTGRCMPDRLIDCVLESGARYLTIYSLDTGWENKGIGKLIHERVVDKVITSHVGTIDQILSLKLALEEGKVNDGTVVTMIAAGIGYTWAANIIRWGDAN